MSADRPAAWWSHVKRTATSWLDDDGPSLGPFPCANCQSATGQDRWALAAKKRFPGLLVMFARLGEQTGQLPQMLDRAAKQLNGEVQRRAMALATMLEPLLIVLMGGMVILIVLAVLLPSIQLNTWVK